MLGQFAEASSSAKANPDDYLDHLSTELAGDLKEWATGCAGDHQGHGRLALLEHNPTSAKAPLATRTTNHLRGRPA